MSSGSTGSMTAARPRPTRSQTPYATASAITVRDRKPPLSWAGTVGLSLWNRSAKSVKHASRIRMLSRIAGAFEMVSLSNECAPKPCPQYQLQPSLRLNMQLGSRMRRGVGLGEASSFGHFDAAHETGDGSFDLGENCGFGHVEDLVECHFVEPGISEFHRHVRWAEGGPICWPHAYTSRVHSA